MRFHIPGIPHTISNPDYVSCAFTQKVRKLCSMLTGLGHEVFHYGCEGSDVRGTHVDVMDRQALLERYPFDMERMFTYDVHDDWHQTFYRRTVEEIESRRQPGDFLLCSWGWGHEPIARALTSSPSAAQIFVVEPGVGYNGVFAPYRAFESYFWMAHTYGKMGIDRGPWYDCVIPNAFDADDFEFRERKDDYMLYLGRIVEDKGVDIALQAADAAGVSLVVAGQGDVDHYLPGRRTAHPSAQFVGFAHREKRRALLAGARALLAPTYYLEPFGGVAVEAMMSGTPAITTDWGGFAETVLHGVTGYRCRTFDQFVRAIERAKDISPSVCREHALARYSLSSVAPLYETFFRSLSDLNRSGWYERQTEASSHSHDERGIDLCPAGAAAIHIFETNTGIRR